MTASAATFARRTVAVVGIVVLAVVLLALLWAATDVLLLLFAAILFACFLSGLAHLLSDHTPLSRGWALLIVATVLLLALGATIWLLAPQVAAQTDGLVQGLTNSVEQMRARLSQYGWGQRVLAQTPRIIELAKRADLVARVTGVFSTTFGVLANVVLVGFIGLYLAVSPGIYVRGIVRLFPKPRRDRIREVLDTLGETLRRWLVGRVVLMISNGLLTTIGLELLGVPMALTLGLVAGLLNFVPNIGPIIGAVPAILIAWTIGPMTAVYVLLLYIFLQSLDGYVFTPLVQRKTVHLPPALTISAQLLFGVLAGSMGLLLATPMTAVALILVQKLYLEDVLGESE
ncbi:MAG: AI-2E family transporter [Spartobacteria bacterium]